MRVVTEQNPFPPPAMPGYWQPADDWRCRWIWHPSVPSNGPAVLAFRLPFRLGAPEETRLHVSADQRYELFLDGERLGRGPQRGDPGHWHFETYQIALAAGDHLLAARVWWLPDDGPPMAQMSAKPGFLLYAQGPLSDTLSTGAADWLVSPIETYGREPTNLSGYHVTGWAFHVDGARVPWGWERDATPSGAWVAAVATETPIGPGHPRFESETATRRPQHHLLPNPLPAMLEVERLTGRVRHAAPDGQEGAIAPDRHDAALAALWQALLTEQVPLEIPPGQRQRILIDLDDYYCAYPELVTTGGQGAQVRLGWAESLFAAPDPHDMAKGNRDEIEFKYFRGPFDRFSPEGGPHRLYDTLWWRAGRYVACWVETGDAPLTIERLAFRETRYPLAWEGTLRTGDEALDRAWPILYRALQMCAHETYMDCPYYEQLMYVGDTRIEALVTYLTSHDDRLPTLACQLFDWSRDADGLTKSRYPSAVPQVIPPFSLWWVAMVHDHWMWRDQAERVRGWLPGVQAVLAAFESHIGAQGLVQGMDGWGFVDWAPGWRAGWPPGPPEGPSALVNLQYVYALDRAAEMLHWFGQAALAQHWRQVSQRVRQALISTFWDDERGLLADEVAHAHFSEHAQCLALLTDLLADERRERMIEGLLHAPDLTRATIYFSHYLLEALHKIGAMGPFFERLAFWKALPGLGFRTTLEAPEPSRSDCHAWGAHPIYHAYVSLLGARPAEPGFRSIRIAPQPGPLSALAGSLPHVGGGSVAFDLRFAGDALAGEITLPEGLCGELLWQGRAMPLAPGRNTVGPA
jgi:hypothetical protein